jgi:hypothetical protein
MPTRSPPTLIAIAACFAGCATPTEMRNRPADAAFVSPLSAQQVVACIADKWEGKTWYTAGPIPVVRTTASGFNVLVIDLRYGFVLFMADVNRQANGSSTRYFKFNPSPWEQYDAPIADCQSAAP